MAAHLDVGPTGSTGKCYAARLASLPLLARGCCAGADVNECLEDFGGCSLNASCTNTNGSHVCQCIQGFDGDGIYCQGVQSNMRRTRVFFACVVVGDFHRLKFQSPNYSICTFVTPQIKSNKLLQGLANAPRRRKMRHGNPRGRGVKNKEVGEGNFPFCFKRK